jgi:serine/threonine protein phosphatase PrpC
MIATVVGVASGTRLSWSGDVPQTAVSFAVIDGMGGYAGGSEAAALVATALASVGLDKDSDAWDSWFGQLSKRIAQAGQAWGTPDMGATVALLALMPKGLVLTNVGDCRIYQVNGGILGQLSIDDRTDDPASNAVTQALGGTTRINAHTWEQEYKGGKERLILCSDGVWGTLSKAVLDDLCTTECPPTQIVDAVMSSAYAQNASDNCSIIVVDLTATPVYDPDARLEWAVRIETTMDHPPVDHPVQSQGDQLQSPQTDSVGEWEYVR